MMTKKNVVFIMSDYMPRKSANSLAVSKVIDILESLYNITVICIRTEKDLPQYENIGLHNVIRVDGWEYKARYNTLYQLKKSNNNFEKIYLKTKLCLIKVLKFLGAHLSRENIRESFVDSYLNALIELDEPIDIIIPICFPYESIVASIKYKKLHNKEVKVAPYLFDKYAESKTLHRTKLNKLIKYKRHLLLEEDMFNYSSRILATRDWEDHIKNNFNESLSKTVFVEIPAVKEILNATKIQYDESKINLIYTGGLDRSNRSPEYALELLSLCIKTNDNIVTHFYSRGNCENILSKYEILHKNNFVSHGPVPVEIAHGAIQSAQVLLSIGNLDIGQKPSKIFEYISCGKPVIHLYNDSRDPVIEILEKYPYSLCIEQSKDKIKENACRILKFIDEYQNVEPLEFAKIKEEFYEATPEFLVNILEDIF